MSLNDKIQSLLAGRNEATCNMNDLWSDILITLTGMQTKINELESRIDALEVK